MRGKAEVSRNKNLDEIMISDLGYLRMTEMTAVDCDRELEQIH